MTLKNIWCFIGAAGAAAILMACQTSPAPDGAVGETDNSSTSNQSSRTVNSAAEDTYTASIQEFRRNHEAQLKAETGWLTIAGLYFLSQPTTTFGSDPLNDFVLPAGAPNQAGSFEVRNGKVSVKAAPGVTFQLGDKTVTSADLRSDAGGTPDRIGLNNLQLWVHMSGSRMSIRLRDKNSRLLKEFTGTRWFPINDTYRVEAQYVPYDKPKIIPVPNILGDIDNMPVPGAVTFTLNGETLKMEPVTEAGKTDSGLSSAI